MRAVGSPAPPERRSEAAAPGPEAILFTASSPAALSMRALAFSGDALRAVAVDAAAGAANATPTVVTIPISSIDALVVLQSAASPARPIELPDPPQGAPAGPRAVLTLADGQRFPGRPLLIDHRPDTVVWQHAAFGLLSAAADTIASIDFRSPAPGEPLDREAEAARTQHAVDEILLANGDLLYGFVERLSDPLTIDSGGGSNITLPLSRIARIRFAPRALNDKDDENEAEPAPSPAPGPYAWLADGAVVRISALSSSAGKGDNNTAPPENSLSITLATGRTSTIPAEWLIAITASPGRIVALSSLEPAEERNTVETPHPVRMQAQAPAPSHGALAPHTCAGAADLHIPGPMLLRWRLPPNARCLIGAAAAPRRGFEWSDAPLTIWLDRAPAFSAQLTADNPEAPFAIPTAGAADLIITITPGAAGPTQAVATLHQPILVLGPDEEL